MQIGDILHEKSKPIFWGKKNKQTYFQYAIC